MFGSCDVWDEKRQDFFFFNYIYCPRYIYCVSRYRACLTISEIAVESKLGRVWVPCKWPPLHTQKPYEMADANENVVTWCKLYWKIRYLNRYFRIIGTGETSYVKQSSVSFFFVNCYLRIVCPWKNSCKIQSQAKIYFFSTKIFKLFIL